MSEAKMRDAMDVAWEKNKYEGEESFEADPFDMFRDGYYAACAHKAAEFAKEREHLRAEIARLTEHLKDDCKCTIDSYEQQLSEAHSLIAMQAEALNKIQAMPAPCEPNGIDRPIFDQWAKTTLLARETLSASAESVAAWETKNLEPLRREVAMLRDFIRNAPVSSGVCCCGDSMDKHYGGEHIPVDMWDNAVIGIFGDTQSSAEAYERELKAKALEEAGALFDSQYIAGAKFGWNCCVENDEATFQNAINGRLKFRAQSAQKKDGE